jgi:transposase
MQKMGVSCRLPRRMRPPPTHIPETPEALREEFSLLAQDYAQAYQELQVLRRLTYGQKSERTLIYSDLQTRMEGLLGEELQVESETVNIPAHARKARKASRTGADLECLSVLHDLPEADKKCACGTPMEKVGENHTLIREFSPAQCYHEDHVYPKYACAHCHGEPQSSHETASPFEAVGVGPALAAQVLIAKHDDHLPLNRQEKIFERQGIILSKSHMTTILSRAHELLQGLVEPIRQEILESGMVCMDETQVKVLDEKLQGKSHQGYFWCMGSETAVVYRFSPSREGENVTALLGENYTGHVMADGYAAYAPKTSKPSYTLANCWSHARRKFFDLALSQPIAKEAVKRIGAMYHVESEARKKAAELGQDLWEALAEARRTVIGPMLTSFWEWLEERVIHVLPKSALGLAISYALERRKHLERFLDNPRIPMDNNQAERDLRHVVIGRKNWNFAGSYQGAERLAIFFTLIQSCKRVKLNSWVYLTHVFTVIEDYSVHRLDELTPSRVKAKLQALA